MHKLTTVLAADPDRLFRRQDRPSRVYVSLLTSATLVALMAGGTALVAAPPAVLPRSYRLVWRLLDCPVHGLLALVVTSPLWLGLPDRHRARGRLLWAGAAAVLLDLDHAAAAGSFALARVTSLYQRPATHSLLFAAMAALGCRVLTRRPILGWLTFAAVTTHVLYDASGGSTPFAWPLTADGLPIAAAYAAIIAVHLVTWFLRPPAPF